MREYYIKDKKTDSVIRGVEPSNDTNWPPLDFFRFGQALNLANIIEDSLKVKCPIKIPKKIINTFVLNRVDEQLSNILSNTTRNDNLLRLLSDNKLSYKEQNALLKNQVLSASDLLWFNKDAQEQGYLLDVFHEEKYPEKFSEKQTPNCFLKKDNGEIETIGKTDMSDGELKALLEQRKVVQARIYHRNEHWHCFYFTFKGLAGLESGMMGAKPHYHYISDKSGISREELNKRISECDMPSSKVHIIIERHQ